MGNWAPEVWIDRDWQPVVTYYSDDAGTTPVDVTGYEAEAVARDRRGNEVFSLRSSGLASADGTLTLGGSAGTITFDLPYTVTTLLEPGVYDIDLALTDASGNKMPPLLWGSVTVRKAASRT